jgi:2-keto-3-deoxy-L-rhamnonate aldolase RhmA
MVDSEHNPLTEAQVQAIIYAASAYDTTIVVRVRGNHEEHVKWVLDCGAGGVLIPVLRDAADARHAVEICKYAPMGSRGFGPNRASGFWSNTEYVASANRNVFLICQIELASAVEAADEICRVKGLDGIWIGPGDLAQSLGYLNEPSHPKVQAAIDSVIEAANRNRMPWGMPAGNPDDYKRRVQSGGTLMVLGSDTRLIRTGAMELLRAARGE